MNLLLRQLEAWATGLKNKLFADIFASAKIRITLLYFLVGVFILSISGVITYTRTLAILGDLTRGLSEAVADTSQALPPLPQSSIGTEIAAKEAEKAVQASHSLTLDLENKVKEMIYTTSLWTILAVLISSYILAEITLQPIKRTLENKKRFIGNVSHELRTPLSIIKTTSESVLLDEPAATKEELVTALKSGLEEVDRMSQTLQFLLTFSTFEHHSKNLPMYPTSLIKVTEGATKLVKTRLKNKNISLEFHNDGNSFVKGNAIALEEVVVNLLRNSIQYTPSGGQIEVTLKNKAPGTVSLAVKDSGVGIASEDLPNIFKPFYKAKGGKAETKKHAGLGLAIVEEIVRLHKGTISVASELGRGTTIEINLPGAKVQRDIKRRMV